MATENGTIRVALADDHTMFRKGVTSILALAPDIEVIAEAANGRELLNTLAQLPAPPDVCLLDVNMPELNGYETLLEVKKQYPKTRVLILTMMDHEAIILRMLRAGANGYMLKEDEPEELLNAIRFVADNDFYHSELVSGRMIEWIKKGIEPQHFHLSEKEQEFLKLCVTEMTYKEMGPTLGVSTRTVEGYRDALFGRLHIKSRTGLALYAIRLGLVNL